MSVALALMPGPDSAERSLADIESVLASKLHGERTNVIDIGHLLIEAKRKIKEHGGQWLPWLEKHFGKSERSARNYMAAAEYWEAKSATVADLKLRPSALYWLAGGLSESCRWPLEKKIEEWAETETRIFALAKTKWVDLEDCKVLAQEVMEETKSAERTARHAAAAQKSGAPSLRAALSTVRPPKTPPSPKTMAERAEARTEEGHKRARAQNLGGMVRALIKLIPYSDDLVGTVEKAELVEVAAFLTALAARAPVGERQP